MVSEKMNFGCCRDLISELPDSFIGHILSFLPTKESASTSVLTTRWRYLFTFALNLDFNDSTYLSPINEIEVPIIIDNVTVAMVVQRKQRISESFMDFVERVLTLQGNSQVHKFSIKISDGNDAVDPDRIFSWILNVLQRGVSDLSLLMHLESDATIHSDIFLCKTLVRLKLNLGFTPYMDFEHVHLPKLKTLCFQSVYFVKHGIGLTKFLSGCPMLEDLVLDDIDWLVWDSASVSVSTLKRLKFYWVEPSHPPRSVSFDTPNLVHLEFTDTVADKYPKVNFDSLVEAKIDLRLSSDQIAEARFKEEASFEELQNYYANGHAETDMVANATVFIRGLCNVKILYLSAHTLEVLNYGCEAIPLFKKLTHLTIESNATVGWKSLPGLLKNSPNLETLVLLGLVHKATDKCGDVCLCKPYDGGDWEEEEVIHTCLSSSPVKVLKIMRFAETFEEKIEKQVKQLIKQLEQVEYFIEMMPNVEQLVVYCETSFDEQVMIEEVSTQLQRIPKVASRKCNLQLISSIVPSSVSMKWASLSQVDTILESVLL